ncbi:MAG: D-glucuronyl C5-epimerase family protein [Actinobacteria bacterium]|nr:D-glucuronyl C5-epimerase family protein [Actinomycetota bacterium]
MGLTTSLRRVRLYSLMLHHWVGLIGHRGYWHAPQELGIHFVPGHLHGYFNDLTNKVNWSGPTDEVGLLLNRLPSGDLVYFPTALFQKALGHWDLWLASDRRADKHRDAFLTAARWAVAHQDERGGWTAWSQLGLHYQSPYSALTQGEGASLLVRAAQMTGDELLVRRARMAIDLMLTPVDRGGLTRAVPEGLIFEEISNKQAVTILNGWVFALFGLYDYFLARPDHDLQNAIDQSVSALCQWLPRFDGGFWSFYDTNGALASPFYHRLHIAQLEALEAAFPDRSAAFSAIRQRFEWQRASRARRMRAIACKVIQKFKSPPDTVLR